MKIKQNASFERQLKKLAKKHFPVVGLKSCLKAIIEHDDAVLKRIKDRALKGKWHVYREFHPARYGHYSKAYDGWIVIYCLEKDELILLLVATGSYGVLNQ